MNKAAQAALFISGAASVELGASRRLQTSSSGCNYNYDYDRQ
ncbi:MAG: hypothetical protein ABIO84_06470 [Lysobacter sp.]